MKRASKDMESRKHAPLPPSVVLGDDLVDLGSDTLLQDIGSERTQFRMIVGRLIWRAELATDEHPTVEPEQVSTAQVQRAPTHTT